MRKCKYLTIEPREASPAFLCEINTGKNQEAIKIKEAYGEKYTHPYLINGECMFCRPDGDMRDCPYYVAK